MIEWKKEQLVLTILYRILECKDQIPVLTDNTDFAFIEEQLAEMHANDLIAISDDNTYWVVTEKGEGVRDKMLAIYDQGLKFEVFGTVHLALELDEGTCEDDGDFKHSLDHFYDDRFDPEAATDEEDVGTEDMRIAMMTYLSACMADTEEMKDKPQLDPHRIVYMQFLAEGRLRAKNIWFELALGDFFNEVEELVGSQYKWTDVADDEEDAKSSMEFIYTAGMLEQRKRDGHECSDCGIPLAIFEMNAKEEGEEFTECPNPDCGADFTPPVPDTPEYECPQCNGTVHEGQRSCNGCGALLDFGMPSGTISESTEVTEEVTESYDEYDDYAWGGYYGYTPYGYYDPYDPYVDVLAFGVCCAVLW